MHRQVWLHPSECLLKGTHSSVYACGKNLKHFDGFLWYLILANITELCLPFSISLQSVLKPCIFCIHLERDSVYLYKILIAWNKLRIVFCIYSVIEKDGLNFVSLYFKSRTSDKYDAIIFDYTHNEVWRLEVECWNEDETHAARQSATQF